MKQLILMLWAFGLLQFTQAQTNSCTVQITGFKSNSGKCLVSIFKQAKGFPTEFQSAFENTSVTIRDGKCTVLLKNLFPGEYAVAVVHDENGNGKLDTNFLGIPKEGIGTSNNAKSTFGPPSFEDSRFTLGNKISAINITIKYL